MRQDKGAWRPAGAITALLLLSLPTAIAPARAFGTIGALGQNHEHQHLTRLALAGQGIEPATLDSLAGTDDSFGAIGQADAPWRGMMSLSQAHCDNGDYLAVKGYPQTQGRARAILTACRDWTFQHLDRAVRAAGDLDRDQTASTRCQFKDGDTAKCRVLGELGLALHASQDFYAHSNWSDANMPGKISGLGQTVPAPWLDPDVRATFPNGLVTGCWKGAIEALHCGAPQIRHADLNKDNGMIDVTHGTVGAGTTPRGKVNDNFRRAVTVAMADTAAKWSWFERQVRVTYGESRGQRLLCCLKHDAPQSCLAGRAA